MNPEKYSEAQEHVHQLFFLYLAPCQVYRAPSEHPARITEAEKECDEHLKSLLKSDILRDLVHTLIRARDLGDVEDKIEEIRERHNVDANRLVCLMMMVEGRLAYANGDYLQALRMHRVAAKKLAGLPGGTVNATWERDNLIHWLKVEVADSGPWTFESRRLARQIRDCCPAGQKNVKRVARLIRIPRIGNWLDDLWRAIG